MGNFQETMGTVTSLEQEMKAYQAYHLTRGNRITHFIGIPLIFFSLFSILGWFPFNPINVPISAATLFLVATFLFYLRLNKRVAVGFLCWSLPTYILADEVAVMSQGRIVELGTAETVIGSPHEDYTRRLITATPSIARSMA